MRLKINLKNNFGYRMDCREANVDTEKTIKWLLLQCKLRNDFSMHQQNSIRAE